MTAIAPHITAFFEQRLPVERGASEHTRDSYAYAFKLFLTFVSKRLKVAPSQLALEQIHAPLVVDFLNDLEATRGNGPSSRNVRLAAIKSFMLFLEYRVPSALEPSIRGGQPMSPCGHRRWIDIRRSSVVHLIWPPVIAASARRPTNRPLPTAVSDA
jgi:site-specific recombinase XerD